MRYGLAAVMAWMNAEVREPMEAIAKTQAEALLAQMRSQPQDGPDTPNPLTRQQRFRKLLDGET